MRKLIGWAVFALMVAVIGGLFVSGASPPTKTKPTPVAAIATCTAHRAELQKLLADTTKLGVLQNQSSHDNFTDYDVDEDAWRSLTHNGKVGVAMAAYCDRAGAMGRVSVIFRGLHDGKIMASVTDGEYVDS